jgi:glycosyltransferase involved in cell wall biosynthesis
MVHTLIAIPAYNEEPFIKDVLLDIFSLVDIKHVLVVDDGSLDDTSRVASDLDVRVLTHQENRGKGEAILTALRYAGEAGYKWILTLDGDGQHRPSCIGDFLRTIESDRYDVILGNRVDRSGAMPLHRMLSNGITSIIVSLCAGNRRIHDSQCGFRAWRVDCVDPADYRSAGFQFETEMLLRLGKADYRFGEVAISTHYGREDSSMDLFRDTVRFIVLVLKSFFW